MPICRLPIEATKRLEEPFWREKGGGGRGGNGKGVAGTALEEHHRREVRTTGVAWWRVVDSSLLHPRSLMSNRRGRQAPSKAPRVINHLHRHHHSAWQPNQPLPQHRSSPSTSSSPRTASKACMPHAIARAHPALCACASMLSLLGPVPSHQPDTMQHAWMVGPALADESGGWSKDATVAPVAEARWDASTRLWRWKEEEIGPRLTWISAVGLSRRIGRERGARSMVEGRGDGPRFGEKLVDCVVGRMVEDRVDDSRWTGERMWMGRNLATAIPLWLLPWIHRRRQEERDGMCASAHSTWPRGLRASFRLMNLVPRTCCHA